MSGVIATLNAGSSSLKFAVFDHAGTSPLAILSGKITSIGRDPAFAARDAHGRELDPHALGPLDPSQSHEDLTALLLPWLDAHHGNRPLVAVGHRVVHGGERHDGPALITDNMLAELDALSPLAPLHQPHNLAAIRAVAAWHPDLPQVACFDTSFHRSQNRLAQLFALPRALSDEGILRYGFHGLSYDYISAALPAHLGKKANGRVIVAHLGNGSSMCALRDQKSVATTMGFTALDGLMMGRRTGTIDPGVILYLMQAKGMTAGDIEDMLYRQSGLAGVSGISNNMQVLLQSNAASAREAIELYCYRAASALAGLIPAIGGLDAVVFTAGIGENAPAIRQKICDHLGWLGVALDPKANARNGVSISLPDAPVDVLTLPTNEEAVLARACRNLVA